MEPASLWGNYTAFETLQILAGILIGTIIWMNLTGCAPYEDNRRFDGGFKEEAAPFLNLHGMILSLVYKI